MYVHVLTSTTSITTAATKALGPFPLIIGEEAGAIVKKAAIFSDKTKEQLNDVLKKNSFTYRVK